MSRAEGHASLGTEANKMHLVMLVRKFAAVVVASGPEEDGVFSEDITIAYIPCGCESAAEEAAFANMKELSCAGCEVVPHEVFTAE